MDLTDSIAKALTTDPLAEAEHLTGRSYKDDGETMRLGFAIGMLHNEHKESLLQQGSDSYYNMPFAGQLDLFADLGFAEVYRETFAGTDGAETYVILWHPEGILATCESYGTRRNAAKIYYNYRHQSGGYPGAVASGGGMNDGVWIGDHDAREGIRHNLDALRSEGAFLSDWVERPFLWLLNYSETKGDYDYAAINAAKIARLPEPVRRSISPAMEV